MIRLSPPADPPPDSLAASHYFAVSEPTGNEFSTLYRTNLGYGVEVAEQPSSRAEEGQIIFLGALTRAVYAKNDFFMRYPQVYLEYNIAMQ